MTGESLVPIAAVFVGVLTLTLVATWVLAQRDPGSDAVLGGEPTESADDDRGAVSRPDAGVGTAPGDGPEGDPPPLDADGETVVCRHCGAENRPSFRYCRWCVRSGFAGEGPNAAGGPTMTERSL